MIKKNLKTDFNISKSFLLFFLAIFLLFYFSGCATKAVYKYAEEKAAPHYAYREIKSVVSAIKQENGDISVCVELNSSNEAEAPKLNTIATSSLPIERLEVHNKDRNQLHDLLDSYNGNQQATEKIFEVSFVSDVADMEKNTDNDDSNEVIDNIKKGSKDILLIYWPVKNGHQPVPPIHIANLHEDISTNIYYLAVPLVFVVEAAVITVAIGLSGGRM
jgi:hypothetical protein